ncbi:MAG: protein translocase subunit SecD [Ignavibacteriae bacterium]|nr:protein translocase subunit SecD [Ignavibacteriota bacterium]
MKKNLTRIILTLVFIAVSIVYLWPTYTDYTLSKELNQLTGKDSLEFLNNNAEKIRDARDGRIKLGLDLKGGMYVVLDVDVVKLLEDVSRKKDDPVLLKTLEELKVVSETSDENILKLFKGKLAEKNLTLKNFYGELTEDESAIEKKLQDAIDNAIDRAIGVVRNRVDRYGVAEPQIQKIGSKRIIVELPGVSNPEDVRKLLKGTALLTFHLLKEGDQAGKILNDINKTLALMKDSNLIGDVIPKTITDTSKSKDIKKDSLKTAGQKDAEKKKDTTKVKKEDKKDTKKETKKDTTKTKKDTTKIKKDSITNLSDTNQDSDTNKLASNPLYELFDPELSQRYGEPMVSEINKGKIERYLNMEEVKAVIPSDVMFAWSYRTVEEKGNKFYFMYILKKDPELTGNVVTDAKYTMDQQSSGKPVVTMEMNSEGTADWARITGANINKRCAIVLDGVVYSAPVIRTKITGGNSMIEGMANLEEAKLLAIVLQSGALPAPLKIIEERSIGPSLGEDSIRAGIMSSVMALLLVAMFMVVYYQFGGSIADLALVVNVLFVMGILASFKATLTVPGIAGLILTLGMAVDTNVLIFERIREELKTGKPLKTALDIGYKKAFSAIIDSHITSVITGIILYIYGSGPIKGFAVTLLAGIVSNLFTAIVITHFIFDILLEKGKKLSFG